MNPAPPLEKLVHSGELGPSAAARASVNVVGVSSAGHSDAEHEPPAAVHAVSHDSPISETCQPSEYRVWPAEVCADEEGEEDEEDEEDDEEVSPAQSTQLPHRHGCPEASVHEASVLHQS